VGVLLYVYRYVRVVGVKKGWEAGHSCRILRAAGARKSVESLRAGFSGGADPEGRRRHIVSAPLVATNLLAAQAYSSSREM
jgi:hypothetical protein